VGYLAVCVEEGLLAKRRTRDGLGELEMAVERERGERRTYDETSHRPDREEEKIVPDEGMSFDLRTNEDENRNEGKHRRSASVRSLVLPLPTCSTREDTYGARANDRSKQDQAQPS